MIILLKAFYILFFGCADLILYSLLHKKDWVNRNHVIIYSTIFLILAILHTGIIKLNFLMPKGGFFECCAFLLIITIMHFSGKRRIRRIDNPDNRVSQDIKDMFKKFGFYGTMIIPYFLFFIIQTLFAITF